MTAVRLLINYKCFWTLFSVVFFLLLMSVTIVRRDVLFDTVEYPDKCWCQDENFCLPPLSHLDHTLQSKFFDCKFYKEIANFRLRSQDTMLNLDQIELNPDSIPFVTATSANHFDFRRGLIRHLRKKHPVNPIIFYDLGLEEEQRTEVKRLCNVTYIRFPFEKYPEHVESNLLNFAWKVLIISEQLLQNRAFIYFDSIIRFSKKYNATQLFEMVKEERLEPQTSFKSTYHSIYATTAPSFYDYIPLPESITKQYRMDSAGVQLILPVNYTKSIMKWVTLCALTEDCIQPEGHKVECKFEYKNHTDYYLTYHNCHRYDQSLFNSVMARQLLGDENYALQFGYTNETKLDSYAKIKDAVERRRKRHDIVNKMIKLPRDDVWTEPLDDYMC